MKDIEAEVSPVTPELLLRAYAAGVFPMAESAEDPEIFWVDPRERGVMPLDGFHLGRTLRRALLRPDHAVTVDQAFGDVVRGCAERRETWINGPIRALYGGLHAMGHAHSVEVWRDNRLIGGLYGVRLGAAFFGESMFSRAPEASKIAFAHLVARLRSGGFQLLDCQFLTPHLARLGARAVSRAAYQGMLGRALRGSGDFYGFGAEPGGAAVVQRITQTS